MILEDFFTLTEMKDGLTSPNRVEELLTVMQKEKDFVVKNAGEATRQWSTVASTIAATENKDCLDLFIRLDGLWFINRWLNDAQKFGNDTSDSFVEESISSLLQAADRLHLDNERSCSSGIWTTVKNLLGHNSSRIQDRARELINSWKQPVNGNEVCQGIKEAQALSEDAEAAVSSKHDAELGQSNLPAEESKENASGGNSIEAAKGKLPKSRSADYPQAENLNDILNEASINQIRSPVSLNRSEKAKRASENLDPTTLIDPVEENLPMLENSAHHHEEEAIQVENCGSLDVRRGVGEGNCAAQKLDNGTDDGKQRDKSNTSQEHLREADTFSGANSLQSGGGYLGADAAKAEPSEKQVASLNNDDTKEGDSCLKSAVHNETGTSVSEGRNEVDIPWSRSHNKRGSSEDLETSFPRLKVAEAVHKDKHHASDKDEALPHVSEISNSTKVSKGTDANRKTFDFDVEYGMVDALEVARRVAKAVEREVGNYSEPFCSSSSEKISVSLIGQQGSPDSINANDIESSESLPKAAPAGQNLSFEASPEATQLVSTEDIVNESENCAHEIESSQVTEAAEEPEANPEKGICGFDLNEEVCSEDLDPPIPNPNVISDDMDRQNSTPRSAPVSVVSASRALAIPGLPASPLQFEGTLGWKGSAATSAFRPASPRRICDGDKTATFGSSDSSKQRQDFLDIDLNVAEDMDDKNVDHLLGKDIPVSSSLPSGESCVELGPKRSERMELDLNSIGDAGEAPQSDWRMDGRIFNHRSTHRSPSPASSSSSMQPRMKNIDLNEGPTVHNNPPVEQTFFSKSPQYANTYATPKPVNPVISIMGARVEVSRKDLFPQNTSLPNGKSEDPTMDPNLTRTGNFLRVSPAVSYPHSSPFGYNGITMGSPMPLSSGMHGPGSSIAYMVDSRGAPVVPQIMGSSSSVPPSYAQSPFIMGMTGTPQGLSWATPSRPSFDINSGFMNGGVHRHDLASRHLFIPGQGILMEDHFRADSQPSSSSEKRKEPDSGWETYPHNLKHHQPPWK